MDLAFDKTRIEAWPSLWQTHGLPELSLLKL
jgi:hypothetical protein